MRQASYWSSCENSEIWGLFLDSILKGRNITLSKEVHLVKAMVFLIVIYGCESWTIKKAEHTHARTYMHTYTHAHTHTYTHTRTHTHTHKHTHKDHLEGYWITWKDTGSPRNISDHPERYWIIQKDIWSSRRLSQVLLPKFESTCFYSHDLHYHCYYSHSCIYKRCTRIYKSKQLEEFSEYEHTNITSTRREGPSVASLKPS